MKKDISHYQRNGRPVCINNTGVFGETPILDIMSMVIKKNE